MEDNTLVKFASLLALARCSRERSPAFPAFGAT
jgi:hypothetical protein